MPEDVRRWKVVRVTYHLQHGQTLGSYRYRWMAEIHYAWINLGGPRADLLHGDRVVRFS